MNDSKLGMHSRHGEDMQQLCGFKISPVALVLTVQKWELSQEEASILEIKKMKKIHQWNKIRRVSTMIAVLHAMIFLHYGDH